VLTGTRGVLTGARVVVGLMLVGTLDTPFSSAVQYPVTCDVPPAALINTRNLGSWTRTLTDALSHVRQRVPSAREAGVPLTRPDGVREEADGDAVDVGVADVGVVDDDAVDGA
jgi:hypothetical protein